MAEVAGFLERFGALIVGGYFVVSFVMTALMNYALQAISDKTEATASWVAWIPIVQTHAFVRAAGVSYLALTIWSLLGIAMIVGAASGSSAGSAPALLTLGIVGYTLASLVWLAAIFWRLAERRGLSGWVGLACVVPLLGLPFYLYLAFYDGFVRPSRLGLVVTLLLSLVGVAGMRQDLGQMQALLGGDFHAIGADLSEEQRAQLSEMMGELGKQEGGDGARAHDRAPQVEATLRRWITWGVAQSGRRRPEPVTIPDAIACAPGTRLVGDRPPRGTAMWCEKGAAGVKQGWYVAWYPDGGIREAGRYRDGKREGLLFCLFR